MPIYAGEGRATNPSSSRNPSISSTSSNAPTHSSVSSSIQTPSSLPRLQFPAPVTNGGSYRRTSDTSGSIADATHPEAVVWRRFPSSSGNESACRQSVGDVFPAKSVQRQPDDRRASVDTRLVGAPEVAKLRRSTVDGWQVDKRSDHQLRPDHLQRQLNGNENGGRRHSNDNYLQTISHTSSTSKMLGVSDRRIQQQTSVSTAFRAYSNLATACRDDDDEDGGRNRDDGDDGKSESADDDDDGSSRLNDTKSDNRSTTSSTVDEEERRRSLIKFSSLPNIYQPKLLRRLRQQLGTDAAGQVARRQQQQHRHNNGAAERSSDAPVRKTVTSIGNSNVAGSEEPSTLSSSPKSTVTTTSSGAGDAVAATSSGRRRDDLLERSSALFAASMPCISSACVAAGRGLGSRRYLPSLGVPEEVSDLSLCALLAFQWRTCSCG